MKLIDTTCPHCGAVLKVDSEIKNANCEFCGTSFVIDDESQQIVFDAEEAGYKFEKGRQRAQAEARNNNDLTKKPQTQKIANNNNSNIWLWVVGWIVCFPIPLTVLLYRKKNMKPSLKYGLIVALWIACMSPAILCCFVDTDSFTTDYTETTEQISDSLTEYSDKQAESPQKTMSSVSEPIEMNELQLLFSSLTTETTREKIDAYIAKNGFVKYAFVHDSAYQIGYEQSAIRPRGRDREGEAVDINFETSGDISRIGMVKSASYAMHTGFSTHCALKFKDGIFYYEGEACTNGEEAMQRFLANNIQESS